MNKRASQPKPLPPEGDNMQLARELVRKLNADPAKKRRISANKFGDLFAFGDELRQLRTFQELISSYLLQEKPKRPLCLAVFGPPGSGKSFAVKQVLAGVAKPKSDMQLPLVEVNLTQAPHPDEVGRVLARLSGEQNETTVPLVFFDEFDAARDGARFGWLGWFLAPMNDGTFIHEGALVRFQRAVYVFAGGTAETLREFAEPAAADVFRFAKGPDFVSRLRGVLEVQGPNNPPRLIRRALILRHELRGRVPKRQRGSFHIEGELLDSLLDGGRYRHGARSVAAIVEMSRLEPGRFVRANLPSEDFLAMHVDRGPLDPRRIEGAIAFSGKSPEEGDDEAFEECWSELAHCLWDEGATLAYAGRWDTYPEESLTAKLFRNLLSRAAELRSADPPQSSAGMDHQPRLRTFEVTPETSPDEFTDIRDIMHVHPVIVAQTGFDETMHREIVADFRRRLESTECSVARVVVGGKRQDYHGRMPGIVEEVMLSLAKRHPVYIVGGFGGAAEDVGMLLGLARERSGGIPAAMQHEPPVDLGPIERELRAPPLLDAPLTGRDAAEFLRKRAFGGDCWPENGLTRDENRSLFQTRDLKLIRKLIVKGLRKRFGPLEERTGSQGTATSGERPHRHSIQQG
ncbi:MAG TPA: hypothetical protein VEX86_22075 [Longimicrobium sp.]|nr:hypothetical protein [Longimicrobium sp.]